MLIFRKARTFLIVLGCMTFLNGCGFLEPHHSMEEPVKVEEFKRHIDRIDPEGGEFPGGRGEDQLVLYTPKSGERTGTNQWGAEAVVEEGVVTAVGGNNSPIPQNGFVLSGHLNSAQWIMENLFPGVEVTIEGEEAVARITAETRLKYAEYLIDKRESATCDCKNRHPSISRKRLLSLKRKSRKQAAISRKKREKGDKPGALQSAGNALDLALDYYYRSQPSHDRELRSCWYRLQEKSPEQLEETIKKIADAGFNCLCPETIYWGYAIYPGAHPQLGQNPDFEGWDPLEEMCRLCHKYGLKIVPWVEVYFIGFEESPLREEKSHWLALSREGGHASTLEKGYYYFCPSREEVREFWLEVYTRLIERYDIDGLQLDYIRYPRSEPWQEGFCYCPKCREAFFNRHQLDPASLDPEKNPPMWEKWNQFRRDQVTEFVRRVSLLVNNLKPELKLSVDVFPDTGEATDSKFQDWPLWIRKGYIDEVFIMSYTSDVDKVREESELLSKLVGEDVKGYVGLGPYMGMGPMTLVDQIRTAREGGSDGVCLFSLEHLEERDFRALSEGPFRLPAQCP